MKLKRVSIDEGSCNGCESGKLKQGGMGLDFPYKEVTQIKFNLILISLCDECLTELKRLLSEEVRT